MRMKEVESICRACADSPRNWCHNLGLEIKNKINKKSNKDKETFSKL